MTSTRPARHVDRRSALLTAALLGLAGLNLLQFSAVEAAADGPYRAQPPYANRELSTITAEHYGATQRLFGLHVTLAALTPGARLTIDPSVPLSDADLLGLGRLDQVRRAPVPAPDPDVRAGIETRVVAAGEHTNAPWTLSLWASDPVELLAFMDDGTIRIVDTRLVTP